MSLTRPLEWSEDLPGDENTSYDHCIARTPFGKFRITWKGWKQSSIYAIDETPWGEYGGEAVDLEDAKQACAKQYSERVTQCLKQWYLLPDRRGW